MKILLADDHVLFREGVRMVLEDMFADGVEIFETGDYSELLDIVAREPHLDVALVDLWMPGTNGFAGIEAVRRAAPSLRMLVISAFEDPRDVRRAMAAGANGFIGKSSPGSMVVEGIRKVINGEMFLAPAVAAQYEKGRTTAGDAGSLLTNRQREVLLRLQQGKTNKEIARDLGLAEITVKLHVTAILRAFGADNRTQVVIRAGRKDL